MKSALATGLILVALSGLVTSGCTQMPTEKQGISDMRPQVTFKGVTDETRSARVLVDGLDMGQIGDYLDGVAALRVLPGTHVIKIEQSGRTLAQEKVYLGDGVSRSILVK